MRSPPPISRCTTAGFVTVTPLWAPSSPRPHHVHERGTHGIDVARRRVHGAPVPDAGLDGQWAVVDAFVAAPRAGDFGRLLAVLDPDVVLRSDGRNMGAEPTNFSYGSGIYQGDDGHRRRRRARDDRSAAGW